MLLSEDIVRAAALDATQERRKSAGRILAEDADTLERHFDIFLSHAVRDADLVLGVTRILTRTGKSVYVDWLVDPEMNRSDISPDTADKLRARMHQCDSLFYLHSQHSRTSRWMPWELGYFDGFNGNVAILPVVPEFGKDVFVGSEYLGLYPYVDLANVGTSGRADIFVNRDASDYALFSAWTKRADKLRPRAA